KMSKSLGNMVFARELLRSYAADDVRAYLLSNHYREAFEWSPAAMARAAERAGYWRHALDGQRERSDAGDLDPSRFAAAFHQVIQEDFDTPAALDILDKLAGEIIATREAGRDVTDAQRTLCRLGSALGFTFEGMSG
ncbi:MAG: cysteine--tRNA ligase, partial [Ardenticatenaceae bacterium]